MAHAIAEKTVVARISGYKLTLSPEEAQALVDILVHVCGHPEKSRRGKTEAVFGALEAAGLEPTYRKENRERTAAGNDPVYRANDMLPGISIGFKDTNG